VAAHRPLADRPAALALARPGLGRRGVDDDKVDRGVMAARAAQHRAPQPSGRERPDDDHAVRLRERAPDRDPVPRVHERPPQRVRETAEPWRPRLPHRVAVERARLGCDQRRLAGAREAGHDDDSGGLGCEEHPSTIVSSPKARLSAH
jgi:hypothetical protein